ncbi:YbjN domain-containing protein [Corynebacterium sp.]|uniref:YbjN domain-containing protein n=1 Tax=Corynebacterium sp. TaxID=1720 RepID=UPI002A919562|nr:YbjN domain-containing protein [Corynebacterium sp.]MDY5786156.1 YbjN domain-containing protein [Corynebacterium sp.]
MSANTATQVTIDRVITTMAAKGITLDDDPSGRAARCNLNGFNVLFVLLDSVLIIRADAETDTASDNPDATLYLAANQINSTTLGARALVVNKTQNIIVRTEAELPVGAGMTDAQLDASLSRAVDGLVRGQDAMKALSEAIAQERRG